MSKNKKKILLKVVSPILVVLFFLLLLMGPAVVMVASVTALIQQEQITSNCEFDEDIDNSAIEFLIPDIKSSMKKQELDDEYYPYLIGQIHQESGDDPDILRADPFQASESLCGSIGCITDYKQSIDQAVKVWVKNLEKYEKLQFNTFRNETVLQSYNYGSGFMDWLKQNNLAFSQENAHKYSIEKTQELPEYGEYCGQDPEGKACYGDYKYVEHVLFRGGLVCSDTNVGEGILTTLPIAAGRYVVTQRYGETNTNQATGSNWHDGIDMAGRDGIRIVAAGDGEVVFAGVEPYGANVVQIKHGKDLYTSYAHLRDMSVKVGDKVQAGDQIGHQGATGQATGSHLHFEVRSTDGFAQLPPNTMNPDKYLPIYGNSSH